jgi:hypothetical protein
MTYAAGQLVAGAGGAVAVASLQAGAVQSIPATEWASFAARYQQYRVRSVQIRYTPSLNVSTALVFDGRIFLSDFLGTATPATVAQILADERGTIKTAMKDWTFTANWARNPNAKLWNPTTAIVPAQNEYAIAYGALADFAANQPLGQLTYQWVVEFRGSQ